LNNSPHHVGACFGHLARGGQNNLSVPDRRAQNLCRFLRLLRGAPVSDAERFGLGTLY
jgi:hypothetical protein